MKTEITFVLEELLLYAERELALPYENKYYIRNLLLSLFRLDAPCETEAEAVRPLQDMLDDAVAYAVSKKICKAEESLLFETKLMGLLSPMPYDVIRTFESLAMNDTKAATDYLYKLSVANNYIRKCDIDKNIKWEHNGSKGKLMITINLSKPEKDPKEIAAAKKAPQTGYPKCALCAENIGFAGSLTKAPRQTLRLIPIELGGEQWFLQFSPYVYFENHCIALSKEHRPMKVDIDTFKRMFDFVEMFPHFFIGSNAALPIVGGSILSHDHYQGGSKVLPALNAPVRRRYIHPAFPDVKCCITEWYNSVVRFECADREQLTAAIEHFISEWFDYTDKSANIIAADKEQHNAITPIVRIGDNGNYVTDMILRNNRTDKTHPYGIFHPTEDLHNIKKEGIGLIEAMGLFILPGRLAEEAYAIRDYLTGKTPLNFAEIADPSHPMSKHFGMIMQLVNDCGTNVPEQDAEQRVIEYINTACEKIIESTAVFKNSSTGQDAFDRFMQSCGTSRISN